MQTRYVTLGANKRTESRLISSVKLTDFGAALRPPHASREDERVSALARRAQQGDYDKGLIAKNPSTCRRRTLNDPDLINEQLTRTASFLGPDRFPLLCNSFVIVVGLGGVGSHCASALARSGVSKIRLVDFDQVTLSSLNRHAVATLADVGTPKVECVKKRLQAVVPWVQWECFNEIWRHEQAEGLLGPWGIGKGRNPGRNPDFVVDAIDNIDSKTALLEYCHRRGIKVVSSMGAGCKGDPTRVFVGDISMSMEDPLSRVTRRRLRAVGISEAIPVVYSTEKPGPGKAQLLPLPEEDFLKGHTNELSVLPDFRARILPVLGTMPAVFGYILANFVILELTGYPHESGAVKGREKMYDNILTNLQGLEERLIRHEGADSTGLRIPVTKDDVGYLVEEVYRGKSVVSSLPTRLALVRWKVPEGGFKIEKNGEGQKTVKLSLTDLVCMTKDEAAVHEKEILKGSETLEELYSSDVLQLVERRRREERYYHQYR